MTLVLALLMTLTAVPLGGSDGPPPPNILLLIADDLGVDRVAAYGEHPDPGHTPVIDQLAADGTMFRNAWSNPFCSGSRATILTGRYSFRTGVGSFLPFSGEGELDIDEVSIADVLPPAYRKAAVGKWHLSGSAGSNLDHPMLMGFEHHRGSISNFPTGTDYFSWDKNVDGTIVPSTTYATTDTVNEALALIDEYSPEPWFLWVAFNAPHRPYHHPPANLHSFDLPVEVDKDNPIFMKALTEAMDTEIGRLLSSMDPAVLANTIIIFVGDNGTNDEATTAPFDPTHAKGTVFEGGVNVPLIVKGPGVGVGEEITAIVNTTDIFATVAELTGGTSAAEDSVSMVPYLTDALTLPIREFAYCERFSPDFTVLYHGRNLAIRERRFKIRRLIQVDQVVGEQFFDLVADPFEQTNLLNGGPLSGPEQLAYERLSSFLLGLTPSETWQNLAYGLPGTFGTPALTGSGTLLAGEPMSLSLTGAVPDEFLYFLVGYSFVLVDAWGGTIVPFPNLVFTLPTDGNGDLSLGGIWPAGLPTGFKIYFQAWQPDLGGLLGFNASNGLMSTAP